MLCPLCGLFKKGELQQAHMVCRGKLDHAPASPAKAQPLCNGFIDAAAFQVMAVKAQFTVRPPALTRVSRCHAEER